MAKTKPLDLPPDIIPADLLYPTAAGERIPYRDYEELNLPYELLFYRTERFGWVLTTLLIGGASRSGRAGGQTDRYYGITLGGELVRVGKGPHVLAEARVILSKLNLDRLCKYIDLHQKGLGMAGDCRDTISTRRARSASRRNFFMGGDWDR